jgi:hypothetical protein
MSIRSQIQLVVVLILALVVAGPVAARNAPVHAVATGKLCGAGRCVALPVALADQLSRRDEAFSSMAQPRSAPYYRIDVTRHTKYGIRQVFLWVPSRHVFRATDYLSPRIPSYWRSANTAAEPALSALARGLKPLVPTHGWR